MTQCLKTKSLPEGQIPAQGVVGSEQIEKVPFVQAVTGGTGASKTARGELTVNEAGPQPATLTYESVEHPIGAATRSPDPGQVAA